MSGSLRDALEHLTDALARLSSDAPWARGDGYRVLGDVHAAIGDGDAALAAYEKAYALGWDPEPGHAMLLLARGEADAAYESLERSLIGRSWWTLQRQGILLAHLALVAAHAGRQERAQALITDLAGQAERWPMASIRALTNEASAVLARQRSAVGEALRHLHLARQLWTSIELAAQCGKGSFGDRSAATGAGGWAGRLDGAARRLRCGGGTGVGHAAAELRGAPAPARRRTARANGGLSSHSWLRQRMAA